MGAEPEKPAVSVSPESVRVQELTLSTAEMPLTGSVQLWPAAAVAVVPLTVNLMVQAVPSTKSICDALAPAVIEMVSPLRSSGGMVCPRTVQFDGVRVLPVA